MTFERVSHRVTWFRAEHRLPEYDAPVVFVTLEDEFFAGHFWNHGENAPRFVPHYSDGPEFVADRVKSWTYAALANPEAAPFVEVSPAELEPGDLVRGLGREVEVTRIYMESDAAVGDPSGWIVYHDTVQGETFVESDSDVLKFDPEA